MCITLGTDLSQMIHSNENLFLADFVVMPALSVMMVEWTICINSLTKLQFMPSAIYVFGIVFPFMPPIRQLHSVAGGNIYTQ